MSESADPVSMDVSSPAGGSSRPRPASSEWAPGSGVRRYETWRNGPAILLEAESDAPGRELMLRLVPVLGSIGKRIGREVLLESRNDAGGTQLFLGEQASLIASRRTSVTVDAQAGRGSAASCVAALRGALEMLDLLGCQRDSAPPGIDWLARDSSGHWVLNALDPGLWTAGCGRNWSLAAYDVAWAVALGHAPSMHAPPPDRALQDCPPWLAEHLRRLVAHEGEPFRSIGEARRSLDGIRRRRIGGRIAATVGAAATLAIAVAAWIDARIATQARHIEERSDGTVFSRREELATLVAEHPFVVFGRSGVRERLSRLEAACDAQRSDWERKAEEALSDVGDAALAESRLKGLIERAEPFSGEVAGTLARIRGRRAAIRAEVLLAARSSSIPELLAAARAVKEHPPVPLALLGRLLDSVDALRWAQVPPVPGEQASARDIDRHLESLKAYLGADPVDEVFSWHRGRAEEAERIRLSLESRRDGARLRDLDERLDQAIGAGNPTVAAGLLVGERRNEPNQSAEMRKQLLLRAKTISAAQEAKLAAMAKEGAPLAEHAKRLLDWKEAVGRDPEAFPPSHLERLGKLFAARFWSAIGDAESLSELPAAGEQVKAALGVAGGVIADELLRAREYMDMYLRSGAASHGFKVLYCLWRCSSDLGRSTPPILHFPEASGIRITLLRNVDDNTFVDDWFAEVPASYPFKAVDGSRVHSEGEDLKNSIVFRLDVVGGEGLYVPQDFEIQVRVVDYNYLDPNIVLFDGKLQFTARGLQLRPVQAGSDRVVHVELVKIVD